MSSGQGTAAYAVTGGQIDTDIGQITSRTGAGLLSITGKLSVEQIGSGARYADQPVLIWWATKEALTQSNEYRVLGQFEPGADADLQGRTFQATLGFPHSLTQVFSGRLWL